VHSGLVVSVLVSH